MEISKTYFWCDSTIVLGYISNEKKRYHTFVANRIYEIRQASSSEHWHHVPGPENPANIASRGMDADKLEGTTWFTGPQFLQSQEGLEQRFLLNKSTPRLVGEDDIEVKKVKNHQGNQGFLG